MEFQRNFEGLTCTCSKNDKNSSKTAVRPKNLYSQYEDHEDIHAPRCREDLGCKEKHNVSVSLSQIIGSPKCTQRKSTTVRGPIEIHHSVSSPFIPTYHQDYQNRTKDLTSSGSSRYGSSDASPEGIDQHYVFFKKPEQDRPLSNFEKDNLLCIQEWKDKQRKILKNLEKQVEDLPHPYYHQRLYYNESLNERHPLDEVSPREGSPFPRRKEYPPTAFFPSKTASSKVLRSISLEEETEEEGFLDRREQNKEFGSERVWDNYTERLSKSQNGGGRRTWSTSPSHEFSPLNAWWTNISPSPNSGSPINSPSFRRKSSSSLSSHSKLSVAACSTRTASNHFPTEFESPPSVVKRKFSYRSFSSPATPGYLSKHLENFNPHDLSYSFTNFDDLRKCRPELEDVGGRGGSILSNSSDEEPLVKKTMLPPTAETNREVLSDEDTTRKQQADSKSPQSADTTTKTNGSTSSNNSATATSPSTTITSSSSSANQKVTQSSPNQSTTPQSQNGTGNSDPTSTSPETRKPSPMAFTVDLDSVNSDSSTSGNSAKKLNISASISQWAPKHKRNLSLTKVEEHKKVDERQGSEKPPLGRPRSGTVGACPPGTKRGTAGYHSEGYFSSDQDDDRPNRTDLKSPRSPRTPDTVQAQPLLVRSNSQDSSKGASVRMRPPSPLSPSSPYGAPLNETASFLIEKMMNATPETKRKFSNTKPEGRTCCKERERKPSVSELTGKTHKSEKKMGVDSKKPPKSPPIDDYDTSKDEKDDVSEAGTYTIDKDSPTPDEDQARNDIDGVFGITTESEAETTTTTAVPMSTTDQCPEDESSWLSASEIPSSISRSSPNWIQQWAAQVAEQTKPPVESLSSLGKSSVSSPRGHTSSLISQDSNDTRPRRKLPTPPSHLATTAGMSPRSDPPTAKHRARVDKSKGGTQAFRNTSLESHESGGDSDFDTCNSYPFNDDERMSASLKSKLRLTGLIPQTKNISSPSAGIISPRRPDGGTSLDSKIKSREASYDMYSNRRDDRGLHSDSSSEASEPYKDVMRTNDKNPPLKFNRAFSLRRARLGCDEPVSTSVDKKKVNRASSAGASSSARKGTLGASKSYQSVDNASVSSPRNYGYGSPRGIASPSQNVVGGSKGTPQSDNFDRSDGGRYSLRLPRSGSSSIVGLSKSPSKSSIHKKEGVSNRKGAARSNSTLSSKEVDFQNWKRRKNYDPMKAAAEGRKKQVEKKVKDAQPSAQINSDNRSPSPPGSLLRSASFHGTEGVMPHVRWTRKTNNTHPQYTSEDDGPYSLEEEVGPHPSPMHGSPLHRSPTSPHQLCQSPIRHAQVRGSRRPSLGLSDEGEQQYQPGLRKVSLEESGSEGKRSPLNPGARTGSNNSGTGAGRPKTKMEALDNLVISTIHSLSVKVRTTSESLLQKLKSQYDEEGDRAALLEEVLSHLSESDQSLTSGQTRSTSRELAGILRNLKKIEHALEVIDKVIIVGEEDYRDDDVDYVPTEWVEESDY